MLSMAASSAKLNAAWRAASRRQLGNSHGRARPLAIALKHCLALNNQQSAKYQGMVK